MAKSERKFYRNVFTVEVLSEEPIMDCPDLLTVAHNIDQGDWSGETEHTVANEECTGEKMAKLLEAQGSDPGFFMLTTDGEDAD